MKYADASAILRVLFGEPGSTMVLSAGDVVVSSQLVEVETFRALDRVRLLGLIDDRSTARKRGELSGLLRMMDLVAIDDSVIARAREPFGVHVRALDAIHVATAESLGLATGEPLEFWTHDQRQAIAAEARGLTVRGLA